MQLEIKKKDNSIKAIRELLENLDSRRSSSEFMLQFELQAEGYPLTEFTISNFKRTSNLLKNNSNTFLKDLSNILNYLSSRSENTRAELDMFGPLILLSNLFCEIALADYEYFIFSASRMNMFVAEEEEGHLKVEIQEYYKGKEFVKEYIKRL